MRELGLDAKRFPPRSVAAVIGQAKAELIDFEALRAERRPTPTRSERRIADVYREYQRGCWPPTPWTSTTCCCWR